ncbi:MAG: ABC-F family ATP-binding cassette domain-containing protein [Paludibacteraceae bacterium]|nr:ABC-F family ATP-binding cassette domain-containing protein [Paludibacteraceae bacterium]
MVSIEHLTMEFSSKPIFDDITFLINPKDKMALVGKNGAGKTTLLRLLAGEQTPTSGTISKVKELTIGYLPQHLLVKDARTVLQEAQTAFSDILEIEQRVEHLTQQLAERTDYESDAYQDLIEQLSHENERLTLSNVANMQAEIEKTLIGLGFERTDFERQTSEFSGGWRMRIELAKVLLRRPQLVLLDEPTNHLDIESIQWLEQFLATYNGAVVLVSHDRTFLDRVTTRTVEISLGRIYDYKVPYSQYVALRKERREQQLRAYENQQKMIADTEAFIERFRYKATKAVQVQSRIKQLDKLERLEVDEEDNSTLRLKFPPAPHSGSLPVNIEGLKKAYGTHVVFHDVEMQIKRGEKVAFVGRNGEGKSTLVKCIMDEIDYEGKLQLGHMVKIGYFAQNQASLLDEEKTVFQTIDDVAVGDIRTKIRDILGAFMFGGDNIEKKVKVLSGGERSRLAMIRLLLEPVNLLILDEPTNHLDMRSKDVLKEAIREFTGTVIVVSHDRDFLDGLVEKVYEFGHGRVRLHLGGIAEFLETKQLESLRDIEKKAVVAAEESRPVEVSANKQSYEERKQQRSQLRKIEREVEQVEQDIARMEQEVADMEGRFAAGENSAELTEQYGNLKHRLDQKVYEWELLSEKVETLRSELEA